MDKLKELEALVVGCNRDAFKFYKKDNQKAGARLRKVMQEIKATANEIRKDVLVSRKNKARAKSET